MILEQELRDEDDEATRQIRQTVRACATASPANIGARSIARMPIRKTSSPPWAKPDCWPR